MLTPELIFNGGVVVAATLWVVEKLFKFLQTFMTGRYATEGSNAGNLGAGLNILDKVTTQLVPSLDKLTDAVKSDSNLTERLGTQFSEVKQTLEAQAGRMENIERDLGSLTTQVNTLVTLLNTYFTVSNLPNNPNPVQAETD